MATAGRRRRSSAVAELDVVERLAAYAEARGHTLLELSLSYLAAHAPVATVIAGATSPAQVRANAAATGAWRLTVAELDEVAGLAPRLTGFARACDLRRRSRGM